MQTLFLAFLTALIISFLVIPSVIRISHLKNLFDEPDKRKSHKNSIPTLGGVAIFAGLIFSLTFWSDQKLIQELQYILAAIMILFFMGIKDDLLSIRASKKLVVQVVAAFLIVHWTNIRLTTFYGLFGIWDIGDVFSYLLSIFTIVSITNAFNLIDGIDGLAGSIGIITSAVFGCWFALMESYQYAILAFSLMGALLGFLYYNWSPAKIFMGDTGSLLVGFVTALLAVKFIEMNRLMEREASYKVLSVPVVTIGILIIPLFDTLRVFTIRILKKKSPFSPDRNHLHHLLLDRGLTHSKATLTLAGFNVAMIALLWANLGRWSGEVLLAGVIVIPTVLSFYLSRSKKF
jgi:UDP-GlcNAc:undecaprenyl-phosphate/decaprenyl-phosphate GlcNAc-1-phosphate transferase